MLNRNSNFAQKLPSIKISPINPWRNAVFVFVFRVCVDFGAWFDSFRFDLVWFEFTFEFAISGTYQFWTKLFFYFFFFFVVVVDFVVVFSGLLLLNIILKSRSENNLSLFDYIFRIKYFFFHLIPLIVLFTRIHLFKISLYFITRSYINWNENEKKSTNSEMRIKFII